jgi:hypothetical protein
MWSHPYIARQLVDDRHETIRRQAGAARLHRELKRAARELRKPPDVHRQP